MHEGQLRQSWQVWRHNNPLSHAEYHADLLLQQPRWHVTKDGLSLLQQVNRTAILNGLQTTERHEARCRIVCVKQCPVKAATLL